jgi:hypothetical protein
MKYNLKSLVRDCSSFDSVKEVMEKYCLEDLNDIFSSLRQAKIRFYASAKQCIYAAERIQGIITKEKEDLAENVEKEVIAYRDTLKAGEKPSCALRTNGQLALGYTISIYGNGKKPVSKGTITEILKEYISNKRLLKFRENHVLRDHYLVTLLETDKSKSGKNGGYATKGLKKNGLTKDFIIKRGKNGAKRRWKNHHK